MSDKPKSVEERVAEIIGAVARAERERIQQILNHNEAAGRRRLAEHLAFSTEHDVEAAAALMAKAARTQPPELRAIARGDGDSLTTKGNES